MAKSRWIATHRICPDWAPTQEGMTDFVLRHRDLPYCANEGSRPECKSCAACKMNGYGDSAQPTIRAGKCYSSPL